MGRVAANHRVVLSTMARDSAYTAIFQIKQIFELCEDQQRPQLDFQIPQSDLNPSGCGSSVQDYECVQSHAVNQLERTAVYNKLTRPRGDLVNHIGCGTSELHPSFEAQLRWGMDQVFGKIWG